MPEYADDAFDGILDKGTLDAILCGDDSTVNALAMLNECYRYCNQLLAWFEMRCRRKRPHSL